MLHSPEQGLPLLDVVIDGGNAAGARIDTLKHWSDIEPKVSHNGREISPSIDVDCLGRYFASDTDFCLRRKDHGLTRIILDMKSGSEAPASLVSAVAGRIAARAFGLSQKKHGVVVCVVPGKVGGDERLERLLVTLQAECRRRTGLEHVIFDSAVLGAREGMVSSYRMHLDKRHREENARNHLYLRSPAAVHDRHVILLDDVVTSGATLFHGSGRIAEGGALSVECIALAKTVRPRNSHC